MKILITYPGQLHMIHPLKVVGLAVLCASILVGASKNSKNKNKKSKEPASAPVETNNNTAPNTNNNTSNANANSNANKTSPKCVQQIKPLGIPLIMQMALQHYHKLDEKVLAQVVAFGEKALASPTQAAELTVDAFNKNMDVLVSQEKLKEDLAAVLKQQFASFLKAWEPFMAEYVDFASSQKVCMSSGSVQEDIINALKYEWSFTERLFIKADNIYRDNLVWITEEQRAEAEKLTNAGKDLQSIYTDSVKALFDANMAEAIFKDPKVKLEDEASVLDCVKSFNFDLHLTREFVRNLDYFRSYFGEVKYRDSILGPIDAQLKNVPVKESVDFKDLIASFDFAKLPTDASSASLYLPHALTFVYDVKLAQGASADIDKEIFLFQSFFVLQVRMKKIQTGKTLIDYSNEKMPELFAKVMAAMKETDKVKAETLFEPIKTWLNGWMWAVASGVPLLNYRYQRQLTHSISDDIHLYTELSKKHALEILKKASTASSDNEKAAYFHAICALFDGRMAVQRTFFSLAFMKMLPAEELHRKHFDPLRRMV